MSRAPKSGVLVAAALLLVGAATAGIAWWYNLSNTRRALEYWGSRSVALIRDAPHVTAFRVAFRNEAASASDHGRMLHHPVTRAPAIVLETRDISRAKGLVHLRHALLDDRSFAWSERPADIDDLSYVLAFEEDGSRLVVYLSTDFTRLTSSGPDAATPGNANGPTILSTDPIANGLETYFADIFQ